MKSYETTEASILPIKIMDNFSNINFNITQLYFSSDYMNIFDNLLKCRKIKNAFILLSNKSYINLAVIGYYIIKQNGTQKMHRMKSPIKVQVNFTKIHKFCIYSNK